MVKVQSKEVLFCVNCGNKATHGIVYSHESTIDVPVGEKPTDIFKMPFFYTMTECETCEGIMMFCYPEDYTLKDGKLLYPQYNELHDSSIPKVTRRIYADASRIKKISPNASSVMIRKALESICKDKGAEGATLGRKLEDLSKKKILPSTLIETGHILREIGNIGAHADEQDVKEDELDTMDDFFKFMVDYIYVTPAKLEMIKKRIKEKSTKKT